MKRSAILCQIALVGALGCSNGAAPDATTSESETTTESAAIETPAGDGAIAATFVSLKVPNMH